MAVRIRITLFLALPLTLAACGDGAETPPDDPSSTTVAAQGRAGDEETAGGETSASPFLFGPGGTSSM